MKILFLIGWGCFAVELIFVAFLFITKNAGDDAAGRGVATGYAVVLLPLLLISGALLYWGQSSSSKTFQWVALLVVAIPFLIIGGLWANNAMTNAVDSMRAAHADDFDDPRLTALAKAIDGGDPKTLKSLLVTGGPIDWQARNESNETLLGYAIRTPQSDADVDRHFQTVRMLLAYGAPLTGDPTYPGKPLLVAIIDGSSPSTLALLRTVLEAGVDPDTRDRTGLPLIHITNGWQGTKKIELLVEYGADLQALNNRTDRPQWTALMNAAYMQDWDLALYFLNHGIRPDYKAPDGNTLASIMVELAARYVSYHQTPPPGYVTLQTVLQTKSGLSH